MPLEKSDASYIWDMLDAAKAVQEFVSSEHFMTTKKTGCCGELLRDILK